MVTVISLLPLGRPRPQQCLQLGWVDDEQTTEHNHHEGVKMLNNTVKGLRDHEADPASGDLLLELFQ